MCERQYRLTDLVNLTGASPARIRKWIEKKVVAGAVPAGRYSYYTQQSLEDIRFVMGCYEGNVSLRDIRDKRYPLSGSDDDGDYPAPA